MKTETFYSRDVWIFLPNIIKIDRYFVELYRFKVGSAVAILQSDVITF